MKRLIFTITVMMAALGGFMPAKAQQPSAYPEYAQNEDPADVAEHGVARISLVDGAVSVARGDAGEPSSSTMNAPLVTADRIATGEGSRAEVQFDSLNLIRLAPNTQLRMGDLQYHRYLVQLMQGTVLFRVLRDNDAKVEVSTPAVSMIPLRAGAYRVTVRPDGTSEITVRAGEANLISASGSESLPAGQTMYSRGPTNDPEFMTTGAIAYDDWDRWNADRDRAFERYEDTSRYASPDIQGTQDLGGHGRWVWDAPYGWVWVPNVAADWAPYRDGRWDYLNYYGWSWVSYDPWGWAPYHYGRWYRGNFGWAWYPGVIGPRHYWRPALVGFFGFGSPGFGASFGFGSGGFGYGNVGWVPLAPYEAYRPWYGRGYGGRGVNVIANINVYNSYRNARYDNAITGLRSGDFGRVAVGRNAFVRPAHAELSRAGMVHGGLPFAPSRGVGFDNGRAGSFVPRNGEGFNRGSDGGSSGGGFGRGGLNQGGFGQGGFGQGGWRRSDAQAGGRDRGNGGFRGFAPQREPQPVRISPPIVNERPNVGGRDNRAPRREFDGFGGFRRGGDGGGFGAPPAATIERGPQGGSPQGGPPQGRAPQGGGRIDNPRGGSRDGGGPPTGPGFDRGGFGRGGFEGGGFGGRGGGNPGRGNPGGAGPGGASRGGGNPGGGGPGAGPGGRSGGFGGGGFGGGGPRGGGNPGGGGGGRGGGGGQGGGRGR